MRSETNNEWTEGSGNDPQRPSGSDVGRYTDNSHSASQLNTRSQSRDGANSVAAPAASGRSGDAPRSGRGQRASGLRVPDASPPPRLPYQLAQQQAHATNAATASGTNAFASRSSASRTVESSVPAMVYEDDFVEEEEEEDASQDSEWSDATDDAESDNAQARQLDFDSTAHHAAAAVTRPAAVFGAPSASSSAQAFRRATPVARVAYSTGYTPNADEGEGRQPSASQRAATKVDDVAPEPVKGFGFSAFTADAAAGGSGSKHPFAGFEFNRTAATTASPQQASTVFPQPAAAANVMPASATAFFHTAAAAATTSARTTEHPLDFPPKSTPFGQFPVPSGLTSAFGKTATAPAPPSAGVFGKTTFGAGAGAAAATAPSGQPTQLPSAFSSKLPAAAETGQPARPFGLEPSQAAPGRGFGFAAAAPTQAGGTAAAAAANTFGTFQPSSAVTGTERKPNACAPTSTAAPTAGAFGKAGFGAATATTGPSTQHPSAFFTKLAEANAGQPPRAFGFPPPQPAAAGSGFGFPTPAARSEFPSGAATSAFGGFQSPPAAAFSGTEKKPNLFPPASTAAPFGESQPVGGSYAAPAGGFAFGSGGAARSFGFGASSPSSSSAPASPAPFGQPLPESNPFQTQRPTVFPMSAAVLPGPINASVKPTEHPLTSPHAFTPFGQPQAAAAAAVSTNAFGEQPTAADAATAATFVQPSFCGSAAATLPAQEPPSAFFDATTTAARAAPPPNTTASPFVFGDHAETSPGQRFPSSAAPHVQAFAVSGGDATPAAAEEAAGKETAQRAGFVFGTLSSANDRASERETQPATNPFSFGPSAPKKDGEFFGSAQSAKADTTHSGDELKESAKRVMVCTTDTTHESHPLSFTFPSEAHKHQEKAVPPCEGRDTSSPVSPQRPTMSAGDAVELPTPEVASASTFSPVDYSTLVASPVELEKDKAGGDAVDTEEEEVKNALKGTAASVGAAEASDTVSKILAAATHSDAAAAADITRAACEREQEEEVVEREIKSAAAATVSPKPVEPSSSSSTGAAAATNKVQEARGVPLVEGKMQEKVKTAFSPVALKVTVTHVYNCAQEDVAWMEERRAVPPRPIHSRVGPEARRATASSTSQKQQLEVALYCRPLLIHLPNPPLHATVLRAASQHKGLRMSYKAARFVCNTLLPWLVRTALSLAATVLLVVMCVVALDRLHAEYPVVAAWVAGLRRYVRGMSLEGAKEWVKSFAENV